MTQRVPFIRSALHSLGRDILHRHDSMELTDFVAKSVVCAGALAGVIIGFNRGLELDIEASSNAAYIVLNTLGTLGYTLLGGAIGTAAGALANIPLIPAYALYDTVSGFDAGMPAEEERALVYDDGIGDPGRSTKDYCGMI